MNAPAFGLRQWGAVLALRDCNLPAQAQALQESKAPKAVLACALDVMGDPKLTEAAEATLDQLRRATEAHLVAQRLASTAALARMSAARRTMLWMECPDCEGSGVGAGPDACDTCHGAREVRR